MATVSEVPALSIGATGDPAWTPPYALAAPIFYELKGTLESVLSLFETGVVTTSADRLPAAFEHGRAAHLVVQGESVATFGQLVASESARRKLRQPIFLAEVNLAALFKLPLRQPIARELSRFQAVERDFSFTFPDAILWTTIDEAIRALAIPELRTLTVVEVWRDPKKYPGVYSTLLHTVFQSNDRTLVDTELQAWSSTIIVALQSLGGVLRS